MYKYSYLLTYLLTPAVLVHALLLRRARRFFSCSGHTTIPCTYFAYPQRDGQAELVWVAGYMPR